VNATTELAAPASSIGINALALSTANGTALKLPLKIHLENPFLGSSCYIGSNEHPIVIEFTSGTTSPPPPNKPITGKPGELKFNESETIITNAGNELVNNSYPTPGSRRMRRHLLVPDRPDRRQQTRASVGGRQEHSHPEGHAVRQLRCGGESERINHS